MRLLLARLRSRGRVVAEGRPLLGRGVRFDVAPGARVVLGDGCRVGAGTRFHVAAGEVRVGPGASLGERCVISAHERVAIGERAVLGDEVVLIDFDHAIGDAERPVRLQGLVTGPIAIGAQAVLDDAAMVLRGCEVGRGAHVVTRGVVTRDVAPGGLVEGVPARPPGEPAEAVSRPDARAPRPRGRG
ncbi:MAG: Acetyltransferase (isoleucine patch superfamily)-like protein [Solirubrobacterales bacterium]|jgi:acetyltransferase-like isoleucine patch superfamily enzyme|nr:Acetyltransferase (isoleucine patch superfamily)-like protein [Solirubrobacterales bacterium]